MTRQEFYMMRPGEFWEAIRAHEGKVNADRRHMGELVRGATIRLVNIQLAKKDRIKDPKKFWPMPWDDTVDRGAQELKRLEDLDEAGRQAEVDKFFARVK